MKWLYWLGYEFFNTIAECFCSLEVTHYERLVTTEQKVLVVANHESNLDPPFIGGIYPTSIIYLAKKTLFNHPIARWVFTRWDAIPIDQNGSDTKGIKLVNQALKKEKKVLIFPSGNRVSAGKKTVAKPGVGLIVSRTLPLIQPIKIVGSGLAMPRNSGCVRRQTVQIKVGQAYRYTKEQIKELKTQGDPYQLIADRIADSIDNLT